MCFIIGKWSCVRFINFELIIDWWILSSIRIFLLIFDPFIQIANCIIYDLLGDIHIDRQHVHNIRHTFTRLHRIVSPVAAHNCSEECSFVAHKKRERNSSDFLRSPFHLLCNSLTTCNLFPLFYAFTFCICLFAFSFAGQLLAYLVSVLAIWPLVFIAASITVKYLNSKFRHLLAAFIVVCGCVIVVSLSVGWWQGNCGT